MHFLKCNNGIDGVGDGILHADTDRQPNYSCKNPHDFGPPILDGSARGGRTSASSEREQPIEEGLQKHEH
jgi:hypothetical protein